MTPWVILFFCFAGAPQEAAAVSWAELRSDAAAETSPLKKSALYARFAKDEKPPLTERIRAIREAQRVLPPADPKRVALSISEAQLQTLAGRNTMRSTALADAKLRAKRLGLDDKVRTIDAVSAGDEALARLNVLLIRRQKTKAATSSPEENEVVARVERALPSWLALSDERQHGVARIALGKRALLNGEKNGERIVADAIDALGESADAAGARADGFRALAAHLTPIPDRMADAVAAALSGDRAAAAAPRLKMTSSPMPYARTVETAALCKRARAQSISCAKIETQRFGTRTFYDFSRERSTSFNPARADDVGAEYESLLHDCLAKGAKANLTTQTHVELEWSVNHDGTVLPKFDLRPMRLRGTLVDTCLADAWKMFRYPRYRGEMQHVRLSFDVAE